MVVPSVLVMVTVCAVVVVTPASRAKTSVKKYFISG